MGNSVKYNGVVGLTWNGTVNSFATLAHFAQQRLRSNGWEVSQFQIIGGGNFSFVLDVECHTNAESIFFNLQQTLLGTETIIGGTVFSSVNFHSLQSLQNNCTSGGNTGGGQTYTVVSGDTFSRIAARFGLTVTQLHALNPQVININVISVGQVLRVSGAANNNINVITGINPNTGQVQANQVLSGVPPPKEKNWFDKTFFDGAGAITGVGIGVLVVLGAVVMTQRRG